MSKCETHIVLLHYLLSDKQAIWLLYNAYFQAGKDVQEWEKKCCDNPTGSPIIRPPDSASRNLLKQVTETYASHLKNVYGFAI